MLACPAGGDGYPVAGVSGFSASNYYSIAAGSTMDGGANMTRSVLFRVDALGTTQVLVENLDTDGGWDLVISAGDDRLYWRIFDSGATAYSVTTAPLVAGQVYCATATWNGTTQRVVISDGTSATSSATPGCTYNPTTAQVPALGAYSGGASPATGITLLGFSYSDTTALSEAQAQAHNAACLASGRMETFAGQEGLYRAPDLETDLYLVADWTKNGSPTTTTTIDWDAPPLAYYERADRTAAASYRDASFSTIPIYAVSGSTITVRKSELSGETLAACSVVYANPDGDPAPGYNGYGKITAVADSSTYGAAFWDLTISFEATISPSNSYTLDIHQGWGSTLLWQAQQLPGVGNRWQEHHVSFEAAESAYLTDPTIDIGGAAHRDSSPSSVSPTMPSGITYSEVIRTGLPRACVRTPHLYPYVKICGAGLLWELSDVVLHHTPTSRRVNR